MTSFHPHNYILNYESCLDALKLKPGDRALQHQLVLSLARAGALDFASSEYRRFGLNDVTENEDIMALKGRLSKDLYLKSSGAAAHSHAKDAADAYESAFQSTGGFYSGINSASMALMAELPDEIIQERIEAVKARLPPAEALTAEDHYFIEATRAECFLLRGDMSNALRSLRSAINFDPLNYSAHATTLKQFRMIGEKRNTEYKWLSEFNPPLPIHFAGRIRLAHDEIQSRELQLSISDMIQKKDIGSGFGSLAAGGDILVAEAILGEGGHLHVIFPSSPAVFLEHSVRPFGADWVKRYQACLEQAASVTIIAENGLWPNPDINRLSGLFAMGQAILAARIFNVEPGQILIYGEDNSSSYTAVHANDWSATKFAQWILPSGSDGVIAETDRALPNIFPCRLQSSTSPRVSDFQTPQLALGSAFQMRKKHPNANIALHMNIPGEDANKVLEIMLDDGLPNGILISEVVASLLAYGGADRFDMTYAGTLETADGTAQRCYTVRPSQSL